MNITGGGGLSAHDVLMLRGGAKLDGAPIDNGAGLRYMDSNVSTESV